MTTNISKCQFFIRSEFRHLKLIYTTCYKQCGTGIQKPFSVSQFQFCHHFFRLFILKSDSADFFGFL